MLSTLAVQREPRAAAPAPSVLAELAQGLRFVASRPAIVFVIVTTSAAIVAAGVFDALIAIYVRGVAAAMFAVGLAGYAWVRGWRPAATRPAETAP